MLANKEDAKRLALKQLEEKERLENEIKTETRNKVNLAIRIQRANWLLKPLHFSENKNVLIDSTDAQLKNNTLISTRTSMAFKIKRKIRDFVFGPQEATAKSSKINEEEYMRKKTHRWQAWLCKLLACLFANLFANLLACLLPKKRNNQFRQTLALLNEAAGYLSVPKFPINTIEIDVHRTTITMFFLTTWTRLCLCEEKITVFLLKKIKQKSKNFAFVRMSKITNWQKRKEGKLKVSGQNNYKRCQRFNGK